MSGSGGLRAGHSDDESRVSHVPSPWEGQRSHGSTIQPRPLDGRGGKTRRFPRMRGAKDARKAIAPMVVFAFLMLAVAPPVGSQGASPPEDPIITSVSFSRTEMDPGESMIVEFGLDAPTEVQQVVFEFRDTAGCRLTHSAQKLFESPVQNGTFAVLFEWPVDTRPGTYELASILVRDVLGETRRIEGGFLSDLKDFVLGVAGNVDCLGPLLRSVMVEEAIAQPGQSFNVSFTATDASGIEYASFELRHVAGCGAPLYAAQSYGSSYVQSGTHRITGVVPKSTVAGVYKLTYAWVRDE